MKIVFICSCIQPGHDGVGDYTRRLAAQLIAQGNAAAIVALNDRFVSQITAATQSAAGAEIPVMRIPADSLQHDTLLKVKSWIDDFGPDWLSLQFVPFGFQPKGLPYRLAEQLQVLGRGYKWHIMLHELWVGIAQEESKKLKYWGKLQRLIIKSLLKKLQPQVIHTQTELYRSLLGQLGFKAQLLPLFGNMPVVGDAQRGQNRLAFVIFGLIHSGAPVEAFAAGVAAYAKAKQLPVSLTFVGRCGAEQERWANAWQANGLELTMLGEQSPEEISRVLLNSTMGISATALAVIGKSGSVAAMHEHGLPVLSVSKPWTPTGVADIKIPDGVIEYQPGNFEACMKLEIRALKPASVNSVAAELISSLQPQSLTDK